MQPAFERQNYLYQPKVIRASSNRANLFYMVTTTSDDSPFLEVAAFEAQESWKIVSTHEVWPHDEADQYLAKAIIYVQRRAQADELASLLNCGAYTAGSGTAEEKAMIIRDWLTSNVPFLVATTALGAGFDYPYIRMVLHVDEPTSLIDFAQASGRAGRDGQLAFATVLLPHSWRATSSPIELEQAALHRYLKGLECYRACLSAALDIPSQQRTSCLEVDVKCYVCTQQSGDIDIQVDRVEPLPLEEPAVDALVQASTGSQLIHEQRYTEYQELQRYKEDLRVVIGTCVICRVSHQEWDHEFSRCSQRSDFIRVREEVKALKANWIQAYHACFWCYNPQSICGRADPIQGHSQCRYPDIVLQLCFAVFNEGYSGDLIRSMAKREFTDVVEFLRWCGTKTTFGGGKAIWGVRVAAAALVKLELF
jgi:superfamily II DNA helicase RecQ